MIHVRSRTRAELQEAIDRCVGAGGGRIVLPSGNIVIDKPLHVWGPNIEIVGQGRNATTLLSSDSGSAWTGRQLIVQKKITDAATTPIDTSLVPGAGASMYFRSGGELDHYYLNLQENYSFTGIDTRTQLCVELFYKPEGTINDFRNILSANNTFISDASGHTALQILVNNDASLTTSLGIGTGGTVYSCTSAAGAIQTGQLHHICMDYDGVKVRQFINGVKTAEVAATGAVYQKVEEHLILGPFFQDFYEGLVFFAGPSGWVDSLRISGISRHTANFTAPRVKHTHDEVAILTLNFEGGDSGIYFKGASNGVFNIPAYFVIKDYFLTSSGTPDGFVLRDLAISSALSYTSGIYANNIRHLLFQDLLLNQLVHPMVVQNNCYGGNYRNIIVNNSALTGMIFANVAGVGKVSECYITGCPYGIWSQNGTDDIDDLYVQTFTKAGVWLVGDGATPGKTTCIVKSLRAGDEGNNNPIEHAALVLEDMGSVGLDQCNFGYFNVTNPHLILRGTSNTPVEARACQWVHATGNPTERIHFQKAASGWVTVTEPSSWVGAGVPWTASTVNTVSILSPNHGR